MSKNTPVQLIYFVGFIAVGLLLSQLILFLSMTLSGNADNVAIQNPEGIIDQLNAHQLLIQQLISQVFGLILPCYAFIRLFEKHFSFANRQEFQIPILLKSLLLFLVLMPLVGFTAYLNQLITAPEWVIQAEARMIELMEKMFQSKSVSAFLISLVVIAVIPAIAEEWAFRGILQNIFIRMSGNTWIGLLISSVIFSAVHMQFLGFLPRFLLGWILGFIYLRSGNLWYPIILHFLNNAIQLTVIYTVKENTLQEILEKSDMPNIYALILCTLLAVWMIRHYFKANNPSSHA